MKCYKNDKMVYNIYIIVINNVFDIENPELLKNKYDLKGSTFKRITSSKSIKKGAAKKDLNFINERTSIILSESVREKILFQISKDVDFLEGINIIDYSLLVGIINQEDDKAHGHKPIFENSIIPSENKLNEKGNEKIEIKLEKLINSRTFLESKDRDKHYYLGTIDALTFFGGRKRSEFVAKRVFQGKGISCVPPLQYRNRFYDFAEKIIVKKKE